ncbi:MAG: hypothetical protein AAGG68_16995 [Bacteroidota bacterium]
MKYSIVLLLLFPVFALAQSKASKDKIDSRLYEVFDGEYLEQLQKQNPFLLQRWSYYLDHAYYIVEDTKLLMQDYPSVKIEDLSNFNLLQIERRQGLKRFFDQSSTYRIEGTNKALVYYPAKIFNQRLNKYLNRTANDG